MSELKKTELQKQQPPVPKRIQAKEGSIKKKPLWKRVKDALFVTTAKSVGNYLWRDVLLPAIKKLVADAGANAINMAVYGEQRPYRGGNGVTHVSQSSVYNGRAYGNQYNRSNRYQDIMSNCPVCDKGLLEDIMDEVIENIRDYGQISVQTLSQILPVELSFQTVHTDLNWGWRDLNYNCIVQVPGGYILSLPPARPLQ